MRKLKSLHCLEAFRPTPKLDCQTLLTNIVLNVPFSAIMSSKGSTRPSKPAGTCDVCKLRHQKCDGIRPSCQYCELRDLQCVYTRIPAHQVRGTAVRKKPTSLRSDSAHSIDAYHPLPNTGQDPDARFSLRSAREGADSRANPVVFP